MPTYSVQSYERRKLWKRYFIQYLATGDIWQPISHLAQRVPFQNMGSYIPIILHYGWCGGRVLQQKIRFQGFVTASTSPSKASLIPVMPQVQRRGEVDINYRNHWTVAHFLPQPVPFLMLPGWVICANLAIWLEDTSCSAHLQADPSGRGKDKSTSVSSDSICLNI